MVDFKVWKDWGAMAGVGCARVHGGEVSQMSRESIFLTVVGPSEEEEEAEAPDLKRPGKCSVLAGWSFLFSLEVSGWCWWWNASRQAELATGFGPQWSQVGVGQRGGERDPEWWALSGQALLPWWSNVRTNCALTYTQVLSVLIHARKHSKLNTSGSWGGVTEADLGGWALLSPQAALPARSLLNPALRPWREAVGQDRAEEEERKKKKPLS